MLLEAKAVPDAELKIMNDFELLLEVNSWCDSQKSLLFVIECAQETEESRKWHPYFRLDPKHQLVLLGRQSLWAPLKGLGYQFVDLPWPSLPQAMTAFEVISGRRNLSTLERKAATKWLSALRCFPFSVTLVARHLRCEPDTTVAQAFLNWENVTLAFAEYIPTYGFAFYAAVTAVELSLNSIMRSKFAAASKSALLACSVMRADRIPSLIVDMVIREMFRSEPAILEESVIGAMRVLVELGLLLLDPETGLFYVEQVLQAAVELELGRADMETMLSLVIFSYSKQFWMESFYQNRLDLVPQILYLWELPIYPPFARRGHPIEKVEQRPRVHAEDMGILCHLHAVSCFGYMAHSLAAKWVFGESHPLFLLSASRESASVVESMIRLADWFGSVGNRFDRKEVLQYLIKFQEATLGANHVEVACLLTELAHLCRIMGDLPQTRLLLERAVEVFESNRVGREALFAMCLSHLGSVYSETGQVERGLEFSLQALKVVEGFHPAPTNPCYAIIMLQLGINYGYLKDYDKVSKILNRSLELLDENLELSVVEMEMFLELLSKTAVTVEDFGLVKRATERLLQLETKLDGPSRISSVTLMTLGAAHVKLGEFDSGFYYLKRAFDMELMVMWEKRVAECVTLEGLAEVYLALSDYGQAEKYISPVVRLLEYAPRHMSHHFSSLLTLSKACEQLGDFSRSKRMLEYYDAKLESGEFKEPSDGDATSARELREARWEMERNYESICQTNGESDLRVADALVRLIEVEFESPELHNSALTHAQALATVCLRNYGPVHPAMINAYDWLGAILLKKNQLLEARDYLHSALSIHRGSIMASFDTLIRVVGNLVQEHIRRRDFVACFEGLEPLYEFGKSYFVESDLEDNYPKRLSRLRFFLHTMLASRLISYLSQLD